ncbi:MAG TPA: YciI family protein [Actinomycetota bacterium]
MQYMLLIYGDMAAFAEMTEDEQNANMKGWFDYTTWLQGKGWMKAGDALEDIDQATCVRLQNGERVVTDGPFAETKETLGGYYLLDVADLDEAIEAAGRCPGAQTGTIELRPIAELPDSMPQG